MSFRTIRTTFKSFRTPKHRRATTPERSWRRAAETLPRICAEALEMSFWMIPPGAAALFMAAVLVSSGCKDDAAVPDEDRSESPRAEAKADDRLTAATRIGPPYRPALPLRLIESRLARQRVGTVTLPGGQVRPLAAVGLNVCNTGWAVQGLIASDDGSLETTPPLLLEVATIPRHRFYVQAPGGDGRLMIDVSQFSMERVEGTFAIENTSGEARMKMVVDAEPITVPNHAKLAAQGCYTTGYFKIDDAVGPTSGVFDGRTYQSRLRLDATHDLVIGLQVPPSMRDPSKVFRADLAR